MSNFVGISNPVCLDLPELEQGTGVFFASSRLEDGCVRDSRPPVMLSVSLAAALHGLLAFLDLAAVRAFVYAPATRSGRGVECAALLPIRFALKGN